MPEQEPFFIYRPELFSAIGNGFTNKTAKGDDEVLSPGTHIRCFSDVMLGLPNIDRNSTLKVAPLGHGRSISTVEDLSDWEDGRTYPVLKESALVVETDRVRRIEGEDQTTIYFERKIGALFGDEAAVNFSTEPPPVDQEEESREDRMKRRMRDHVMDNLYRNFLDDEEDWVKYDACAVDIEIDDLFGGTTAKAYDSRGRLVAESVADPIILRINIFRRMINIIIDFIRRLLFILGINRNPPPPIEQDQPHAGNRSIIKLRAPSIHRVELSPNADIEDI